MKYIQHDIEDDSGTFTGFMEVNGSAYARGYTFKDDNINYFLDSLSVSKNSRKLGYGTELQILREKTAKEKGYKFTMLWVKKGTWMEKWYERRGYKYHSPNIKENSVWLIKKL